MKNLKRVFLASTLLTLILALSAATSVHAVEVTASIPVGTFLNGIAYDFGVDAIYVANFAPHNLGTVSVISDGNKTVIATVSVGSFPMGVAYDSGKHEVLVSNQGNNTVSVISDTNNTVVATIPLGINPASNVYYPGGGIACDSATGEIYVANTVHNTVSVISDKNNTVVATVTVGYKPTSIAYDSCKGEIYVTNGWGSNTVSVISDSTHAVVATIPVGDKPAGIAYDSAKGEMFVANPDSSGDGSISVISDANHNVVATVPLRGNPVGAAYYSGKGAIFFTGSSVTGETIITESATVWIMSDETNAILEKATFETEGSSGIACNPAKGEVLISAGSAILVISDSSLQSVTPSPTASALPSSTPNLSPIATKSPSPSPPQQPTPTQPQGIFLSDQNKEFAYGSTTVYGPYSVQSGNAIRLDWSADKATAVFLMDNSDYAIFKQNSSPTGPFYRLWNDSTSGSLEFSVNQTDEFYVVIQAGLWPHDVDPNTHLYTLTGQVFTRQPAIEPSLSASPTPVSETSNTSLILEIAGAVVVAIVVVGLLIYLGKRKGKL